MSREGLIAVAKDSMAQAKSGELELAPEILSIPASNYTDPERFDLEMKQVFRRMPLMVATSAELQKENDYKAMEVAGVPIILSRAKDGEVRAFVNMCRHRGAQILENGNGNIHRYTCPYHAWTYNPEGDLVGVFAEREFGDVDKSCHGLMKLPVLERAGLVWAILDPKSTLSIESFLSGYDEQLDHFGFSDWHVFEQRTVRGPNWKIAYDGYMDLYHLPILHKDTFGANFPHQAVYRGWGPHQRVFSPDPSLLEFADIDQEQWPTERLMGGVWTVFPHVSIASFDGGGRGVMISQLFPGNNVNESFTTQTYLMEKLPEGDAIKGAHEQFNLLKYVVESEDYATGLKQQNGLQSGMLDEVMFGRNEGGAQFFHKFLDTLLETSDEDLPALFA